MAGFERSLLEGAVELDRALAALDREVATRLGVAAGRRSAKVAEGELRAAAPHRPGVQKKYYTAVSGAVRATDYGDLRDNIKARKARSNQVNKIVFDISTGRAFWGYFSEFGTVNQPARPCARPAVEAMKDDLVQVQIDVLKKGINRIANSVAKGKMLPNGRRA